ncbi:hypothetical protein FF2_037888 [Malus domestica]
MAKLLLTVAALFFLFALSHARTSSDLPANEISGRDPAGAKFPESRPKPRQPTTTILLPSEKPVDDPATLPEWREITTSKLPESDGATILANEESTEFQHSETVPLTVISFRPVNRHFRRRPFPLSFRHGHRCRHAHRPMSPRFHGGEGDAVSYGNDMLVASSDDMGFNPAFRGGARQIPARWVNIRHGGPRFPFRHEEDMELERPHHHHHRRHHHEHDHDHDRREEFEGTEKQPREHKHDHEHHGGGLMRRVRKFLNHF